jgi:hypothetical protein
MPFKDMLVVQEGQWAPPGRYFIGSGREVYNSSGGSDGRQVEGAAEHLRRVLQQPGRRETSPFYDGWEFMIGVLRGEDGVQVMDVFGMPMEEKRPTDGLVIRDGVVEGPLSLGEFPEETQELVRAELGLRGEGASLVVYLEAGLPDLPFVSGETHYVRL